MRHLKAQMEELQQVLVANNLIKSAPRAGEDLFGVRSTQHTSRTSERKMTRIDVLATGRTMATGKRRVPQSRTIFSMDLRQTFNTKRSREDGDLLPKLVARTIATILLTRSKIRISMSTPKQQLERYQTPFTPAIEGIDPPEKFNPESSSSAIGSQT